MKIRTSIAFGLTIILITAASTFLIPESKVQGNQNFVQTEIPVVFKPLKVGNDIVPVEIQCEPVFRTRPDTLDDFHCILINKTNKSIRASSIRYSIIFESNGKEEQENRLDTVDTYIHPDLSDVKKPIEPGGRLSVRPTGRIVKRDSVIKRLELEPVYLEFADWTTVGFGGQGADVIADLREGASKYKNALRQEYLKRGRSAEKILPLLEDNAPLGLEILSFSQRTGANEYRRLLRKKYEKNGVKAINDVFNK